MKNTIMMIVGFILCSSKQLAAQMHYSLTSTTSTYTPITNGTSPFLTGNGFDLLSDEGYANSIPIGFNFTYNGGSSYNELSISTNGFISFNSLSNSYLLNNLTSGATGERPIIAPLWDDINLSNTTNLQYSITGSLPNRVFTVEWLDARWGFGATSACISFQVKLYETSNWIEFNYRQEAGAPVAPSASIGVTSSGMGNSNFISLQSSTSVPGASMLAEIATIANKPANNQSYVFKPGVLPVSFASVSVAKNNGSHTVSWQTLNETNNAGFEVQRSMNGNNFSSILFVASKAVNGSSASSINYSANDVKPLQGTNYYRLKQIDKDGKINYSSIVSLKNITSDAWAVIAVYPNPVKDKLTVQLNTKDVNEVEIAVFNSLGKQVIKTNYSIVAGQTQTITDVASLPVGFYTLRITNNRNDIPLIKTFVK
jgi:hypothetical protein